ncbi:hypothetical protein IQ260_09585 [Leptolyngbya cf. ectocarpi LEGE 11479]|uniref:Uncharacterized protein n=1 Tax=Leptolyngbya cf. ectocarpi LEGE 11479 TaxID=1828722 RepID=A0A928X2Z1_LEPEC|nr:hypothetical protein [Leptolyngbya ectocarpi]MBE9066905.1 hypothetical protein [Leptolyngbya cf. ectocarpi LEGE 11479]
MYTAFLALPPLDPRSDNEVEAETVPFSETAASVETVSGLWSNVAPALNNALQKLDSALPKNDAVKYVVIPSMFGGFGSVALQMVQDEGTFVAEPELKPTEERETAGNTTDETSIDTTSGAANSAERAMVRHEPKHDFVPSVEMAAGLEFLILVVSSVLLGAVVGFIGAVLSLDGPPAEANNKSKLAATALAFALFFPSVITVLQQNAESQAKQLKSQYQAKVQDITRDAKDSIQEAEDSAQQAAKSRIDEVNEVLDEVTDNPSQSSGVEEATNHIVEKKSALIDDARELALTATSEESARDFIESIADIGEADIEAVQNYAIDALEEIEENSEIVAEVQQAAQEKAEELRNIDSDNL